MCPACNAESIGKTDRCLTEQMGELGFDYHYAMLQGIYVFFLWIYWVYHCPAHFSLSPIFKSLQL